jgi:3-phosphoshikimate 1-carboxyvinyltransferase
MSTVTIDPLTQPFRAVVAPPGSKSLTNRALVLGALADGASTLSNILLADDTRIMLEGLQRLGFELSLDEAAATVSIRGQNGRIPNSAAELFCGNSGTTIRFLTALCALGNGEYCLDGVPRMRQRPIAELVDMLRHLGVRSRYVGEEGFPPLCVLAHGLPGGLIQFGSARSSQFLSAVLMIAPLARNELQVDLVGPQSSWPYVTMTMQLMDAFGVTPELIRDPRTAEPKRIIVPRHPYEAVEYAVEPDASNAAYFLAAAAIHPGSTITVPGLGRRSLQGDVGFAEVLRKMGAHVEIGDNQITVSGTEDLEGIDVNLIDMPDTAQTLAVVALFAQGSTTIRGLGTLRVKETDRLAALSNELSRLGAAVEVEGDVLHIDPPQRLNAAQIQTYDDHRMAMSFALAATRSGGITILDPQCVSKTYPRYFEDLNHALGGAQNAAVH